MFKSYFLGLCDELMWLITFCRPQISAHAKANLIQKVEGARMFCSICKEDCTEGKECRTQTFVKNVTKAIE